MNWKWAIFIFLNSWWLVLFAILPWGISHKRVVGTEDYAGAPDVPNIKKKMIITTLVSVIVTLMISAILASGLIPLKNVIH